MHKHRIAFGIFFFHSEVMRLLTFYSRLEGKLKNLSILHKIEIKNFN